MYFTVKQPWGMQKPVPGSQIDWGHPLARDFRLCLLFNERAGVPQNLVRQQPLPQDVKAWAGSWASRNSIDGVDITQKAAEGAFQLAPPYTIISKCAANNTTNGNLVAVSETAVNSNAAGLYSTYSSNVTGMYYYSASYKYIYIAPPALGMPYTLSGVFGTAAQQIYYNGQPGPTREDSYTLATGYITWGAWMDWSDNWDGPIDYFYIINRALSAAEVAWLYAEPYAMIQAPEMPVFYSIPAGATIYSRRGISNRAGTRTVWL